MNVKEFADCSLKYIVSEPDGYIEGKSYPVVILLHGFGANMNDLLDMVSYLDFQPCVYVFPNAPVDLRVPYGFNGYAWINPPDRYSKEVLKNIEDLLDAFVDEIIIRYKVKKNNVALGGFSQGGMLSYWYGIQHPEIFKGIISLSGKLLLAQQFFNNLNHEIKDQRIYIEHGTEDNVIDILEARKARDLFAKNGFENIEYYESEIGHSIHHSTYTRLSKWLNNLFD